MQMRRSGKNYIEFAIRGFDARLKMDGGQKGKLYGTGAFFA
jgi:hypothetical protein